MLQVFFLVRLYMCVCTFVYVFICTLFQLLKYLTDFFRNLVRALRLWRTPERSISQLHKYIQ